MRATHEAKRQIGWTFVGLLTGIVIVISLTLLARTWSLTDSIRDSQQSNASTLTLIKDCTEPGGNCYKRNQKASGQAIDVINRVSVYAAACASQERNKGSIEKIQVCVLNRIQQDMNNEKLDNTTKEGAKR